jgi:hypothetical protein
MTFPLSVSVGNKTYTVLYPEPRLQPRPNQPFWLPQTHVRLQLGRTKKWPNQFLLDHYGLRALRNAKDRITANET